MLGATLRRGRSPEPTRSAVLGGHCFAPFGGPLIASAWSESYPQILTDPRASVRSRFLILFLEFLRARARYK
jgi:hypothetical protein